MQNTNFEIELIIANDCSPDATDEIIQSILKNNPKASTIKYTRHEKNIDVLPNFLFALQESKGKYIAICEGDDYWTDKFKLQKQVDFLEKNSEFNLVGHQALSSHDKILGIFDKDTFSFEEINYRNLRIPTASIVFRNNIDYPDWFLKVTAGDRAIIFLNAMYGKLKILPFVGSFYRIHAGGLEQYYKKDKFKKPIRNIYEENIYYNLIKDSKNALILYRKLIRNHIYIIVYSIIKFNFNYFFVASHSLLMFLISGKVKITNKYIQYKIK